MALSRWCERGHAANVAVAAATAVAASMNTTTYSATFGTTCGTTRGHVGRHSRAFLGSLVDGLAALPHACAQRAIYFHLQLTDR